MPKNVLLIVPSLAIGGQERIAVETAALLQQDFDVTLCVFQRAEQAYACPVPLVDLNLPASSTIFVKLLRVIKRTVALKALKKKKAIDISYSFGDIANASNALSGAGERKILSIHGYGSVPKGIVGKRAYRILCNRAHTTICVSKQIALEMAQATGLPEIKFCAVYNPYDLSAIREQSLEPAADLPSPHFVALGRLEEVKGYTHLLRAFAIVVKAVPAANLVFIGDGSLRASLEQQAQALGIAQHVVFLGMLQNPYKYLRKSFGFVLSSYTEGFPNAMIEAMACGLPVVSVDCPSGPREILEADRPVDTRFIETPYGVLCPSFNPLDTAELTAQKEAQLAEGMLHLLNNPARAVQYGQNAAHRADCFNPEAYKTKLQSLF